MKLYAPSGVLVVPSFSDLRTWHGAIFVRKGFYGNNVFKFIVKLPLEYNDNDIYPHILFHDDIFNPFISPIKTSLPNHQNSNPLESFHENSHQDEFELREYYELDLKSEYPKWDCKQHFMVTALTYLKRIFMFKDEDLISYRQSSPSVANPQALELFLNDKVQHIYLEIYNIPPLFMYTLSIYSFPIFLLSIICINSRTRSNEKNKNKTHF